MDVNLGNFSVDKNGSVSFSGAGSGVDFKAAVDAIIAAKRVPVDRLEARVTTNTAQIEAYKVLRVGLNALKDKLSTLYGAVSVDKSKDIFAAKGTVLASSRSDGGTPSTAANLLGVSVTNAAAVGTHTIEVLQTAAAHKVGSNAVGSKGSALGVSGTFTINGQSITLSATDSLVDIRDRINAANGSTSVTASVVSVGTSEHFLVLTADNTGQNISLADTSGTPLQSLGILDGGGDIANELQAARLAQFHADGLRNKTVALYTSDAQSSGSAPVTAGGVGTAGTLEFFDSSDVSIGTLAYSADDTIDELAAAINADTTLAAAGIRAEVVDDVDGSRLQIKSTAEFRLSDTGSAVTDLGLGYKQVSDLQSSASATIGAGGTLTFTQIGGAALGTATYTSGMTLQQVADEINANVTNVSASVVQDGAGYRLEISGTGGVAYTVSDDSSGLSNLGFYDKQLLVERTSNTVGDLFTGVTLNLFAAESGTTVTVDVQRDLSQIKTQISDFVSAYNDLKVYMNEATYVDQTTGEAGENATLLGSATVREVSRRLSSVFGNGAAGDNLALQALAEIGIKLVDNDSLTDPLMKDTLTIDDSTLEDALLNSPNDVRDLFSFRFTSSDPRVTLLSFDGNTQYKSGGYTVNIDYDEINGEVDQANVDGAAAGTADGTATVSSGSVITVTDQSNAQGLTLLYTGDVDLSGVQVDMSVGIGAQLFFAVDDILDPISGSVETEIATLDAQNEFRQTRIDQMLERIGREETHLLNRFARLEAVLAQLDTVRQSITQITDALFAKN